MKRYAILIAVEEYKSFSRTAYCHADATLLAETLKSCCDYSEQDVLLRLLDKDDAIGPSEILNEIENLVRSSEPGDSVLFFFAGHGHRESDESFIVLPSTEANQFATTAVNLRDVSDKLRRVRRLNIRIFDACHSGADVRAGTRLDPQAFARAAMTSQEGEGWVTLAGCRHDEYSYSDPDRGNGIFTYALAESIRRAAPGPLLPESVKVDLCGRVAARSKELGVTQTPVMNASLLGNVAMAERLDSKPVRSTNAGQDVDSLKQRLLDVRSITSLGGEEHRKALATYLDSIVTRMTAGVFGLELFSGTANVFDKGRAESLPKELKGDIVDKLEGRFSSVHTIEWHVEYKNNDLFGVGMAFQSIARTMARVSRRNPRVSQPQHWPASWTGVEISGDGYQPEALLVFYVVPGQTSACILWMTATRGVSNFVETDWNEQSSEALDVRVSGTTSSGIDDLVDRALAALETDLRKAVGYRLVLLENEAGNTQ